MLLLLNILGFVIFGSIMVLAFKQIKLPYLSTKNWFDAGISYSIYLALFTVLLGAVFGIVTLFPLAMQKYCWVILIPLGKFSLYGSSIGLVFFCFLGITRNVTADVKARIKKYKEKKLNQR